MRYCIDTECAYEADVVVIGGGPAGIAAAVAAARQGRRVALIEKYGFLNKADAIEQMHFPKDMQTLEKARNTLIFEEFFLIQSTQKKRPIMKIDLFFWRRHPESDRG